LHSSRLPPLLSVSHIVIRLFVEGHVPVTADSLQFCVGNIDSGILPLVCLSVACMSFT
jgi:hypothetical protein